MFELHIWQGKTQMKKKNKKIGKILTSQQRYSNGQEMYEKVLNLNCYQRNASQNHYNSTI